MCRSWIFMFVLRSPGCLLTSQRYYPCTYNHPLETGLWSNAVVKLIQVDIQIEKNREFWSTLIRVSCGCVTPRLMTCVSAAASWRKTRNRQLVVGSIEERSPRLWLIQQEAVIIIIIIIIRGATALTNLGRLSSRRWQSFPTAPDCTELICGQHIESHSCIFSFRNRTVTSLFK
jgi:hypothetical protein